MLLAKLRVMRSISSAPADSVINSDKQLLHEAYNATPPASRINATAMAINYALGGAAGVTWMTSVLDRCPARAKELARLLLGFQSNGWDTLNKKFSRFLNDPLENPDAQCIWALHMADLTQRSTAFIQTALFTPTRFVSVAMDEQQRKLCQALAQNRVRSRSLALSILTWQRKLEPSFLSCGDEASCDLIAPPIPESKNASRVVNEECTPKEAPTNSVKPMSPAPKPSANGKDAPVNGKELLNPSTVVSKKRNSSTKRQRSKEGGDERRAKRPASQSQ